MDSNRINLLAQDGGILPPALRIPPIYERVSLCLYKRL